MTAIPQSGVLIVNGETIDVKYVLATTKGQYSATVKVKGHVRSPELPTALPAAKLVSATLRLQGGMEISVAVTNRVGDSTTFRALGKPTAWA